MFSKCFFGLFLELLVYFASKILEKVPEKRTSGGKSLNESQKTRNVIEDLKSPGLSASNELLNVFLHCYFQFVHVTKINLRVQVSCPQL